MTLAGVRHHVGREVRAVRGAIVARVVVLVGQATRAGIEQHRALRRHHQHVQHVGAAGAGKMRVREAHDRAVGLVIARARVPAVIVGVGRKLHHAPRHGRTRKGVAMATGADEHVHVTRYATGQVGLHAVLSGIACQCPGSARIDAAEQCRRDRTLQESSACHHVRAPGLGSDERNRDALRTPQQFGMPRGHVDD
jgi:hypothetical protein